jgi:hypothetical protein
MALTDTNPFQELYVTDSPDARTFVELFSDLPVHHALALFRPGHVVLKGTQGSGKSMLLNLLRPQIRLAYHKTGAQLPIPKGSRNFVGAGINLTLSGILDIGQRPLTRNRDDDEAAFPLYFADFLNYFVVRDLLQTVLIAQRNPEAFDSLIDASRLPDFVKSLREEDCWFGSLSKCVTIDDLCGAIDQRIVAYRSFHVFNISILPHDIEITKTSIGEPISRTAECLRRTGVVPEATPMFIRIDQVERLHRSDQLRPALGMQYRRLINKAMGSRDSRVSYRVGTRRYAWEDDLHIYGTDDKLEHMRDFRIIDIDDILRRKEDTKTWVFPEFARDAITRRLRNAGYHAIGSEDILRAVFGQTVDPATAAKEYTRNSTPDRILKAESLPDNWRKLLESMFKDDPLSAMMAAAWARQRGSRSDERPRYSSAPPKGIQPWNRPYWRKERVRQCILQIAARAVQRLKWSGRDQILTLSSGNISIFLSICHEIWEAFLRAERRKPRFEQSDPVSDGIHPDVQTVGIRTASKYWYDKITEQPKGDDRQRVINILGSLCREWLLSDDSMSYPGHNGFSLATEELEKFPSLASFLNEAASYGDLYSVAHTTKERDRRRRQKWYLNPVLSDYFQIPESHAKEPRYVNIDEVFAWFKRAGVILEGAPTGAVSSSSGGETPANREPSLFDGLGVKGV